MQKSQKIGQKSQKWPMRELQHLKLTAARSDQSGQILPIDAKSGVGFASRVGEAGTESRSRNPIPTLYEHPRTAPLGSAGGLLS